MFVARVGLDQISPAILLGTCNFWFLLLTSRAGTNSRANSQGDINKKGEKSQKMGRSVVLEMDKACGNKHCENFVKKLRKRKNKMSARFGGEKHHVRM